MRIELPEQKMWVYETRFGVRWGDMDAMGQLVIVRSLFDEAAFSFEKISV